jgi:hypothetical protein
MQAGTDKLERQAAKELKEHQSGRVSGRHNSSQVGFGIRCRAERQVAPGEAAIMMVQNAKGCGNAAE